MCWNECLALCHKSQPSEGISRLVNLKGAMVSDRDITLLLTMCD
jgi:hypothetical protein